MAWTGAVNALYEYEYCIMLTYCQVPVQRLWARMAYFGVSVHVTLRVWPQQSRCSYTLIAVLMIKRIFATRPTCYTPVLPRHQLGPYHHVRYDIQTLAWAHDQANKNPVGRDQPVGLKSQEAVQTHFDVSIRTETTIVNVRHLETPICVGSATAHDLNTSVGGPR